LESWRAVDSRWAALTREREAATMHPDTAKAVGVPYSWVHSRVTAKEQDPF
jgi:hypothetical protein